MKFFYSTSLIFCFLLIILYGCSAAYKAVKRGDQFLEEGNYYEAAQEYLTALRLKSDDPDTKIKLCQISRNAYEQKLSTASHFEQASQFETSLIHYTDLANLIEAANQHQCINFALIDVEEKIKEVRLLAAEQFYQEAEELFIQRSYANAIEKYQRALKHTRPYKDSLEKMAESYYRIASKLETQHQFRTAAQTYLKTQDTVVGYKDAAQQAVSLYYSLGRYFLKQGWCRKAYHDFNEAIKINQDFMDLSQRLNEASQCATSTIAFMKLNNLTRRNHIAGISLELVITDEIRILLQKKASKFIKTLAPKNLNKILNQHHLTPSEVMAQNNLKKLKGINYLVFGELAHVHLVRPNLRAQLKRTVGEQEYQCTKVDKVVKKQVKLSGDAKVNQEEKIYKESTCTRSEPVMYTEYTDRISLSFSGSIKVFDTSTKEVIISHPINFNSSDSISYADIMTDISKIKVSSYLTDLVEQRRKLKGEEELVEEMISTIANEVTGKILNDIDRVEETADPVDMKIYQG